MLWTSLVHLSQTKKRISKIPRPPHTQFGPPQRIMRWPLTAQKARKRHDLIDDRQISVEMGVFFQKLGQFASAAWQLPLHTADRQMRVQAPPLLGLHELLFQRLPDTR